MDAAINRYNAQAARTSCRLTADLAELAGAGRTALARRHLYVRGWRFAYVMAASLGDHLVAIADHARPESPRVFAHMTVARAALEAAGKVNYVLSPSGPVVDRVLRSASMWLSSAEEERRAVADLSASSALVHSSAEAAARQRHQDILELVERAGVVLRRGRSGRLLTLELTGALGGTSDASLNITKLLNELLPQKPGAYRVGSAAVHGQPWVLDDDDAFDPSTGALNWPFDAATLASSLDLAISGSVLAIESFAAMLGQDPKREVIEAHRREQAASRLAMTLLD